MLAPVAYETGATVYGVEVGDFNNAAVNDIAELSSSSTAGIAVLFGNGDGTFQAPKNLVTERIVKGAARIHVPPRSGERGYSTTPE